MRNVSIPLLAAVLLVAACSPKVYPAREGEKTPAFMPRPAGFDDRYAREEMVILSRHNIRSPLSGSGSTLQTMTPHEWHAWSSSPSELSLRGGVLETEMGQYCRKWFEAEGFFPENYHPGEEEVRIYANSKQRTMATAKYFTAGLLPTADTWTETWRLPAADWRH